MKHCILMSAYKDLSSINNFIKATPEGWGIFVHIDKKSSILTEQVDSRAVVIKKYNVYWGSFLHVVAFKDLMRLAFDHGDYDFFHLVTGQDFYCMNPMNFDNVLSPEKIYMMTKPFPVSDWDFWENGYAMFKYKTLARFCDVRMKYNFFGGMLNKFLCFCQKNKKKEKFLPSGFTFAGGILYSSFPRYAVEYILENENSALLEKKLWNSLCGEEVYFQTLFLSSPYKENIVNDNLRFMN